MKTQTYVLSWTATASRLSARCCASERYSELYPQPIAFRSPLSAPEAPRRRGHERLTSTNSLLTATIGHIEFMLPFRRYSAAWPVPSNLRSDSRSLALVAPLILHAVYRRRCSTYAWVINIVPNRRLSTGCGFFRRSYSAESHGNGGAALGDGFPRSDGGKINCSTAGTSISFNIHDRSLLFAVLIRNENVFWPSSCDKGTVSHFCGFQPNPNVGKTRNQ